MWFRNLRLYRLPSGWGMDAGQLDKLLAKKPLQRCGGMDMISRGWVYPQHEGEFVHAVDRQWLLALGVEQKLLPTTVVRQTAQERAAKLEAEQQRRLGRRELRELREQVTQELLPRAFTRRRTTWAWIDPQHGWLVLDAGSDAKAEEFIETLLQTLGPTPLQPLQSQMSPVAAMTDALAAGEAPAGFSIDQDLELRASTRGQATIRYVRHALEGEEIRQHIAAGKMATRLGLTWDDKISFVLTEKLEIKRLAFLDILKEQVEREAEDAAERLDVDFALMTGELKRLFDDLLRALGGELTA